MPAALKEAVAAHLLPNPPERLAVAVSGGSDSTALLYLLADLSKDYDFKVLAVTVNHGLRLEAAREIAHVAARCAELGVEHHVVRWDGWDGAGNLQDAARRARYRLIADWAHIEGVQTVALGHTADDQAETVLMRLARGSGVDGLSAMKPRRINRGVVWIRPVLGERRNALRDFLREKGVDWCDDPSNDDRRFQRVRVREALQVLEPLGVDASSLGQVAQNMTRAREALDWQSFLEARRMIEVRAGAIAMDWRGYRTLPEEIGRRLLLNALSWIGGAAYPPRRRALFGVMDALKKTPSATLEGCMVRRIESTLWVFREFNAVRDHTTDVSELWDGRWKVEGKSAPGPGLHIGVLGEDGLRACRAWRETALPRDLLLASPAVWNGSELVAAPIAGLSNGWQASIAKGEDAFFAALLSH